MPIDPETCTFLLNKLERLLKSLKALVILKVKTLKHVYNERIISRLNGANTCISVSTDFTLVWFQILFCSTY